MSDQNNVEEFPSTHDNEQDFLNYLDNEDLQKLPQTSEEFEYAKVQTFTVKPGKHKGFAVQYDENAHETKKILVYNTGDKRMVGEKVDFSGDGIIDHILMIKGNYEDFAALELQGETKRNIHGFDNYQVDTIMGHNKHGKSTVTGFWLDDFGDMDPKYDAHGLPRSISLGWTNIKWDDMESRINQYREEFPGNFDETPTPLEQPYFVITPEGRELINDLNSQGVEAHELVLPTSANLN